MTDSPQWMRDRARIVRAVQESRAPVRLDLLAQYLGLTIEALRDHLAQLIAIEWVRTVEYVDLTGTGHQALAAGLDPIGPTTPPTLPGELPVFEITQTAPIGAVLVPPGAE